MTTFAWACTECGKNGTLSAANIDDARTSGQEDHDTGGGCPYCVVVIESKVDTPTPAAEPEGPTPPEIHEETWNVWDQHWGGWCEFNPLTSDQAHEMTRDRGRDKSWIPVLIGVHPSHRERADAAEVSLAEAMAEIEWLTTAVQNHHDQTGDDRCHLDDLKLYHAVLGEGVDPYVGALPPDEDMRESCDRYMRQRRCPGVVARLPGDMTIAQLTAELAAVTAERDAAVADAANMTECVVKLMAHRIVQDAEGRGWWAYADSPEDAQGFPPPVLCLTLWEACDAVAVADGLESTPGLPPAPGTVREEECTDERR